MPTRPYRIFRRHLCATFGSSILSESSNTRHGLQFFNLSSRPEIPCIGIRKIAQVPDEISFPLKHVVLKLWTASETSLGLLGLYRESDDLESSVINREFNLGHDFTFNISHDTLRDIYNTRVEYMGISNPAQMASAREILDKLTGPREYQTELRAFLFQKFMYLEKGRSSLYELVEAPKDTPKETRIIIQFD